MPMTLPAGISGRPGVFCQERSRSTKRYRGIVRAALSGLFGKGTSLLVNAATVPLTVRYLGSEGYGLWITISSAVTMFFVLDIGIANTLTNLISKAYANDDKKSAATSLLLPFGWFRESRSCLVSPDFCKNSRQAATNFPASGRKKRPARRRTAP